MALSELAVGRVDRTVGFLQAIVATFRTANVVVTQGSPTGERVFT